MKRNVNIKSMKYEDFNDNEYIEQMLKELRENGTNVIVGGLSGRCYRMGPEQQPLAADFRHKLLWHRIHGDRRRPL